MSGILQVYAPLRSICEQRPFQHHDHVYLTTPNNAGHPFSLAVIHTTLGPLRIQHLVGVTHSLGVTGTRTGPSDPSSLLTATRLDSLEST